MIRDDDDPTFSENLAMVLWLAAVAGTLLSVVVWMWTREEFWADMAGSLGLAGCLPLWALWMWLRWR